MSAALASAWLAASLLAAEPSAAHEVGRDVGRILDQDRYSFCEEQTSYLPLPADLRWCEVADQADLHRCPGYAEVCRRGRESAELDGDLGPSPGENQDEEREPGQANEGAYEEPRTFELPDLGVFAKILMWALILGGVVAVGIVIAKNLVRGRDEDEPELEPDPAADDSLIAARAAAMRTVETDVQRLLARAEQAAARGDFEAAINDVYAALLRRLEGEQLIVVERYKTNGDYLVELRSRPPLREEVREIVREVEQVQFGAAAAEQGRYANIRSKILAVVGRAALCVALLLGGGALLGCPLWPDDPDALPDSSALAGLGTGPSDQRAVGELLLMHGIEARHRTRSIEELSKTDAAIVLLEDVELLDEDWDTLIRVVEDDGGTLVIATGKEFPRELGIDYQVFDPVTALVPSDDRYFGQLELVAPAGRVLGIGAEAFGLSESLVFREPELDPDEWMYQDGQSGHQPYVIRRSLGSGEVIVFAEPDLWTNVGISVAQNGAFLVNLLHQSEITEVEFVDRYTGAGPDDPFESVGNAKLGGLFLQILLFLALLYAAVGIPFARLRDPERERRRSFVEHVQTLGQRYAQARASRYVAGLYSAWALDRLRDRLLPGTGRGLLPLAQAIAARTGRDETSVMQLLVAAHELRETSKNSTRGSAGDLEVMRQLGRLLDEIGGAR